MPGKGTYQKADAEDKQKIWQTRDLAAALMAPAESTHKPTDFGPLSDVNKFPAMRMLLMKADEDNADKPTKKLINQILDREQMDRTDYLLNADWTGKRGTSFEHVQGRVNNLTYHFMFGLAKGVDGPQYTDGADAFIAIYRNSEQKLSDIIALLPMPHESARPCSVLVRLVYIVEYTRRVVQTEESLSLMETTDYNGVLDEAYDLMSGHIKAQVCRCRPPHSEPRHTQPRREGRVPPRHATPTRPLTPARHGGPCRRRRRSRCSRSRCRSRAGCSACSRRCATAARTSRGRPTASCAATCRSCSTSSSSRRARP